MRGGSVYPHRARGPFLLLALCAVSAPPVGGQTLAPERSPAHRESVLVGSYLDAFNTGLPEVLAPVLERMYAPSFLAAFGDATTAAWERLELHRTYGPLAFAFVDTLSAPPIVWSRGTVSRGWVGHQLFLNELGQATRHSIWRARPVPYPEPTTSGAQVADSLGAYLDQLAGAGLFSGSVVVSRHGVRMLEGSWGNDGQEVPAPVTRDTRFHIASVTKLLTVTALLQLVEAGIVRLEDTIGRWIPEYPEPYRDPVRVRHLLTHTSGIELDDDPSYLADIRVARSGADLLGAQLRAIDRRRTDLPAVGEYDYTSEGIDLLGVIIERATGRSWTDVVREEVLEPAGMRHTRFAVPTLEGAWAMGRTSLAPDLQATLPGELRPALDVLTVMAKPSAGVWSTAEDLHRFTRALLEHRLLGEAWTDSLLTPQLETGELPKYGIRGWVGLGAQGEDLWGTRTVGHGGVVPGYSAAVEYLPDNGWLLTVVSSTGEATGFLVFQRFLELVANDPATGQEPPIDVERAKVFFAEAEALGLKGSDVWGVALSGPLLFVHPGSRHTVANVPDTLGVLHPQAGVWVGELPAGVGIANTAMEWGGRRWTMLVWPLPYGRLSRGRLLAHEMFHRAQPELGLSGRDATNPHLDTEEGRLLLRLEWRALQAALADSGTARRAAVADAVDFRARRHAAFRVGAEEERDLELNEGLAEYTGVRLAIPANARAGWVTAQIENEDARAAGASVGRSFAYATGPAIGLLLDTSGEDWRSRVDDTTSLGALLAEAYDVAPDATRELADLWAPYDGRRLAEEEQGRSRRIAERDARFGARFVSGPILTLPASSEVRYTFNPNDAEPFGVGGTVYGRTEVRDAWGVLRVESGGALLVREDGRIVRVVVPAPAEPGADPFRGDGWTLELADGWTLAEGERPGDFVLVAPQAQEPSTGIPPGPLAPEDRDPSQNTSELIRGDTHERARGSPTSTVPWSDWERFASHFWEGATLTTIWQLPSEAEPRVVTTSLEDFVQQAPLGPGSREVFEERTLDADVRVRGDLAQVWARYHARFGDPGEIVEWEGIDAFTLMRHRGQWRIAALAYTAM